MLAVPIRAEVVDDNNDDDEGRSFSGLHVSDESVTNIKSPHTSLVTREECPHL